MILSRLGREDRIVCLYHNCDLSVSLCGKQTLEEKTSARWVPMEQPSTMCQCPDGTASWTIVQVLSAPPMPRRLMKLSPGAQKQP